MHSTGRRSAADGGGGGWGGYFSSRLAQFLSDLKQHADIELQVAFRSFGTLSNAVLERSAAPVGCSSLLKALPVFLSSFLCASLFNPLSSEPLSHFIDIQVRAEWE